MNVRLLIELAEAYIYCLVLLLHCLFTVVLDIAFH